jgi:hypothetical protein
MSEPMNEELDFNVGEDEQEATVEMNEDGSDAKLAVEELLLSRFPLSRLLLQKKS